MNRFPGAAPISRRAVVRGAGLTVAGGLGLTGRVGTAAPRPFPLLDASGRTATGEPVVVDAPIEPLGQDAAPSGEQVLRLAYPAVGPDTLDPHLARDLPTAFLLRQLFRGLTRLGPDLQPVPELSRRIEISADGLTYIFALRPEATFHNGRQITADDVRFSLTHALDPATAGGEAALLGGPTFLSDIAGAADLIAGEATTLAGVEVIDTLTIAITLVAPRATFLMKLAAVQAAVIDRNNVAAGPEWWREPNGSGPFRLAEWVIDDHLTLARNDGYFAGPPPLEQIEIALGPNASQSFNLYQADRIDLDTIPLSDVDWALSPRRHLRREITITQGMGTSYIAFRNDTPPLDDPRIRRALFLAFPREKVAELSYDGNVTPAAGLIPHGMLGRDWPVALDPYDLEAARAEIAASAYERPEDVPPIEIYTSFGGPAESLRDVIMRDLGMRMDVYSVDWVQFIEGLARRRFPAYAWFWGADYPDPENFIWTLFGEGSPDNYLEYDNPEMNDLVAQARAESDVERRAELYAAAQDLLVADHVVMPLYYDVIYTAAKPYVRGLELTALGIIRLDTIWLER